MRAHVLRARKRKKGKLYGHKKRKYREVRRGSKFESQPLISKDTIPTVSLNVGNYNNAHLPELFELIHPLRHLQVK